MTCWEEIRRSQLHESHNPMGQLGVVLAQHHWAEVLLEEVNGQGGELLESMEIWRVNRKAMLKNLYNHIPHPFLNTKGERRTNTKFDERPRKTRTVNRMNSSFPTQMIIHLPKLNSNIYSYLFSILNYKTEQNRKHNRQLLFS